jgi:ATP-dependent helicase/nuclease subunit B
VCQFDQGVESNDFRKLPVIKKEDLLEALRHDENLKANDGLPRTPDKLDDIKKQDILLSLREEEEDLG